MTADDEAPIVVGGCYRSGTTLLRRVLDAHPRIYCGPEVKFLRDFYGDYLEDPIRHLRFMETARSMVSEPDLFALLGTAFVNMHELAARAAEKPRWADKVPENLVFLDEWERLLGDRWVLLHAARNPLDTLASIEEVEFPVSIPRGLEERIDLYLEYNRAGLAFGERHSDRYVRVLYEDLVSDPEPTVRGLMTGLGEEWDPAQLAIDAKRHDVGLEDPKAARATEIHADSVARWRVDFTEGEVQTIVARTADVWSRLDRDKRWPLPS